MELMQILTKSPMINGFVLVKMLIIEYINIQSQSDWHQKLVNNN